MLRPLLARAERLVAVARFEIELFGKELRVPAGRFALIPNGSDLPKVTQAGSPPGDHHTLIASVGRLERYKGHQRVIAALPTVLERRPDARLWIAGEGPYEPALRRLAERLGVADHVEIRGIPAAERQRMAAELSRAALVVLLSEYETHPLAVIEALSLGCPVLVADNSGLSELARKGLARAIPLNSSDRQVGMAVLEQLSQPRRAVNLELPTWDDCAADLLALYRSVARRPVCAS
jgi:glycosyltransferase involved in cell wall biosynthesis